MSDYVLDREEQPRLAAQAAELDPVTFQHLQEVGVGAGWRCLEIGGGTGSVASWLRERVGAGGQVVVTDIETQWLEPLAGPNLEVRRHDVTADPIETASYDLIHARLVLMHLPEPDVVLAKLVAALRPGGWLVVEEADWHSTMVCHPPHPGWVRVFSALTETLAAAGQDLGAGRRLAASLGEAGLAEVSGRGTLFPMPASQLGRYVLPIIERVGAQVVESGLAGEAELAEVIGELRSDVSPRWAYSPMLVSAWGRRQHPASSAG